MASKPRSRSWDTLSDDAQLSLARQALSRAAEAIASQAECLAEEIEDGTLADRGGAEALRLLVAVVRASGPGLSVTAGHA